MASDWGPEDKIGSLNMQTDASVLKAFQMVKKGEVYSLGMSTSKNGPPVYPPRFYQVVLTNSPLEDKKGVEQSGDKVGYVDDLLLSHCGSTTHADSPFHTHRHGIHYKGHDTGDIVGRDGMAPSFGCEHAKPMFARGVLLNMAAYFGKDIVSEGTAYTAEDILGASKKQDVDIQPGDVVVFYSGWVKLAEGPLRDDKRFLAGEPGVGLTGADCLISKRVMAVGADTVAVEVVPSEKPGDELPVHGKLNTDHGIWLIELMDPRKLVENGISEFCFVFAPPRYTGVVQLPGNPVAIV